MKRRHDMDCVSHNYDEYGHKHRKNSLNSQFDGLVQTMNGVRSRSENFCHLHVGSRGNTGKQSLRNNRNSKHQSIGDCRLSNESTAEPIHDPPSIRSKPPQSRTNSQSLPPWLANTFSTLAPKHPLRLLLPVPVSAVSAPEHSKRDSWPMPATASTMLSPVSQISQVPATPDDERTFFFDPHLEETSPVESNDNETLVAGLNMSDTSFSDAQAGSMLGFVDNEDATLVNSASAENDEYLDTYTLLSPASSRSKPQTPLTRIHSSKRDFGSVTGPHTTTGTAPVYSNKPLNTHSIASALDRHITRPFSSFVPEEMAPSQLLLTDLCFQNAIGDISPGSKINKSPAVSSAQRGLKTSLTLPQVHISVPFAASTQPSTSAYDISYRSKPAALEDFNENPSNQTTSDSLPPELACTYPFTNLFATPGPGFCIPHPVYSLLEGDVDIRHLDGGYAAEIKPTFDFHWKPFDIKGFVEAQKNGFINPSTLKALEGDDTVSCEALESCASLKKKTSVSPPVAHPSLTQYRSICSYPSECHGILEYPEASKQEKADNPTSMAFAPTPGVYISPLQQPDLSASFLPPRIILCHGAERNKTEPDRLAGPFSRSSNDSIESWGEAFL